MQRIKSKVYVLALLIVLFAISSCGEIQVGVETLESESAGSMAAALVQGASTNKKVLSVEPDSAPWKASSGAGATDNQLDPSVQPSPTLEVTTQAEATSTQAESSDQPTSTPSSTAMITGKLTALYSGPSSLFPMLAQYHPDAVLTAQGVTPDRQWAKVTGPDGQVGWLDAMWISTDLSGLPVLTPQEGVDAYSIYGKVVDIADVPVEGIDIAVVAQDGSELRTDANSIADGSFTAYVPVEMAKMSWSVQIVGINCTSRIMTADKLNCQFDGYIELAPHSTNVSILPQLSPVIFRYEAVDQTIQGRVTDANGQPVEYMRVYAVRDDGAHVFGSTDGVGGFSLPVSNGNWAVYTVEYNPQHESEHIQLTIQNNAPANLELHPPD